MTGVNYILDLFLKDFSQSKLFYMRIINNCFPCFTNYCFIIVTTIIILAIAILFISFFNDLLYVYNIKINNPTTIKIYNQFNQQHFYLPLTYKIYSLASTILKCILYFSISIGLFVVLRVSNITKDLNISLILTNISSYSLSIKICFIVLLVIYVCVIILFFKVTYLYLFFELKCLYIYLLQFGGFLDAKSNYYFFYNNKTRITEYSNDLPYIQTFFVSPLLYNSIYKYKLHLYEIIDTRQPIQDYKNAGKFIPKLAKPFLYLLRYSSYKETLIVRIIRYVLTQINEGFWTFVKFLPYFCAMIYFIEEYFFHSGLIRNFYIIAFILYCYNLYFRLIYFLAMTHFYKNRMLCLCYYKLQELRDIDSKSLCVYHKEILKHFKDYVTLQNSDKLTIYLKNDLNDEKTSAIYKNKEWPKVTSDIGLWINCIKKLFSQKKSFKAIKKYLLNIFSKILGN